MWLLSVAQDLMFGVKILEMAKARGLAVKSVGSGADALAAVAADPRAVLMDLNLAGLDGVALINSLKRTVPHIPLICYVSHVQTELRQAAAEAGAEHVIPRSAFEKRLPGLLDGL